MMADGSGCGARGAMSNHVIETVEALRQSYGEPSERAVKKSLDRLDRHCRRFIELSPFLILASAGADGRVDCSPRGDPAGFVAVLDERTVLLPDRLGNNRTDSLRNVLENPHVGMLFMIPGVDETLRLNGRAVLTTDPALLEPLSVRDRAPRSGLVVEVEEVFLQCTKAPGALPAVGRHVACGPQGRAAFARSDARRSCRPSRRRGPRSGDSTQSPREAVLIGPPRPAKRFEAAARPGAAVPIHIPRTDRPWSSCRPAGRGACEPPSDRVRETNRARAGIDAGRFRRARHIPIAPDFS